MYSAAYRPSAVAFDEAGTRAFAVSQDGITVVALDQSAPAVVKNIKLGDVANDPAVHQDVQITPDGSYALRKEAIA